MQGVRRPLVGGLAGVGLALVNSSLILVPVALAAIYYLPRHRVAAFGAACTALTWLVWIIVAAANVCVLIVDAFPGHSAGRPAFAPNEAALLWGTIALTGLLMRRAGADRGDIGLHGKAVRPAHGPRLTVTRTSL